MKFVKLAAALAVVVASVTTAVALSGYIGLEAESGATNGPLSVELDESASGGQAVRFGGEPSGTVIPTASSVGPRCEPTETLTESQALSRLRSTGYLSCATIAGMITLEGSDGIDWLIEDVRFEARGSLYGVRGFTGTGGVDSFTGTQAQRPVFRYVDVLGGPATGHGACSAAILGKDMIFEHANITGCQDGIKADSRLEVRHSWIHDLNMVQDAHTDTVQIVSGQDIVFEGNRFDAYATRSSDGSMTEDWRHASGMLQTGTVSGDISATWTGNWFVGGAYTIRGAEDGTYDVNYTFKNNRWLRFGASSVLGRSDLPPHMYGPTASLGDADFDCSNIWDDTGLPVLESC